MHFALAPLICFTRIILINCFPSLQAMSSDDDFVFGGLRQAPGLPAPGDAASSEEEAVFGGLGAARAAEVVESEDDMAFAGARVHRPLPRRRQAAPLQTSGSFWILACVDCGGEARAVLPTILPGVLELHWELRAMDHGVVAPGGTCGTLVYTARRSLVFDEETYLPADVVVTTLGGWLRALEHTGPRMLKALGTTLTAFLDRENAKLEPEMGVLSENEAETLLKVAEDGTPRSLREVRLYKRWGDPSRIIARHPKPNVLKQWRRGRGQGGRNIDSDDSGDDDGGPADPAPGPVADARLGPLFVFTTRALRNKCQA